MLKRQGEIAHSQGKVGVCHFCGNDTAELWFDPSDDWKPFQVRCNACGARGPWADCGWESAVPAWEMGGRKVRQAIQAALAAKAAPLPDSTGDRRESA